MSAHTCACGGDQGESCCVQVLVEEKLPQNADRLGAILRSELNALKTRTPRVQLVRGRGLLNALVIDESHGVSAWEVCLKLRDLGLLAKPTHGNIIRLAPPLTMTEAQLRECVEIITEAVMTGEK